ncbi:MAG: ACT domain-containing protein [Methylacidiphilales bacterium]|nr:ACT domain-containing protein [Candidatus Methylacidiphilales bacterium]MDW8349014.1 prephenate dehydratase domain-containing protein [Verrucomicrobiae bacterium]
MASLRVAYFGEEGSFTHVAALRRFRRGIFLSAPTVEEAFELLYNKQVRYAVVPIENTSVGIITDTVDQLIASTQRPSAPQVVECVTMPVEFALLCRDPKKPISVIYSHFSPLGHARLWLKEHYPQIPQVVVTSTAEAARRARDEVGAAALAGLHAAPIYQLKVLARGLGREVPNHTSFLILGDHPPAPRLKATHTILIFELPHRPGALVDALSRIASRGYNLTRIQSRPIPGRFQEYRFMIEVEIGEEVKPWKEVMQALREVTTTVHSVGRYGQRWLTDP